MEAERVQAPDLQVEEERQRDQRPVVVARLADLRPELGEEETRQLTPLVQAEALLDEQGVVPDEVVPEARRISRRPDEGHHQRGGTLDFGALGGLGPLGRRQCLHHTARFSRTEYSAATSATSTPAAPELPDPPAA